LSVVYPLWYATPGPQKDDKGAEGGTRQGRITCKGPALLTWPPPIRRALTSFWGVEEGVLVWMDLDQAELRTATLLSGEQSMLRAYREGTDLHRERAALIFDVVVEAVSKLQRQVGKTINFADLFRSGAAKMRATVLEMTGIDLPLEFFEQVARSRKVQRPQLWAWQESLIREVRQHGYLALPFTGQSRYFLGGEKFDENEIVNCPVQTTAGNTLLRIQARLRRTLPSLNGREPWCFVRVNWYDALIVDTKRERLDELKEHVEEAVRWVEREDYWGMLQEMTGNEVALKYDMKYQ
jgi:DNA polymerase-1